MFVWSTLFVVFVALIVLAVIFSSLFPHRLPPAHHRRRATSRHRFRMSM